MSTPYQDRIDLHRTRKAIAISNVLAAARFSAADAAGFDPSQRKQADDLAKAAEDRLPTKKVPSDDTWNLVIKLMRDREVAEAKVNFSRSEKRQRLPLDDERFGVTGWRREARELEYDK